VSIKNDCADPLPTVQLGPMTIRVLPSRRQFLQGTASVFALGTTSGVAAAQQQGPEGKPFAVSLSQRSLRAEFAASRLDPLDFPKVARGLGIAAVEYEAQFYRKKLANRKYLAELSRRAAGEGVANVLILVDEDGALGARDEKARRRIVGRHEKWLEAAAFLGCKAIRVTARTEGNEDEAVGWLSDGLRRLCVLADPLEIDVLVENQAGFSANSSWLVELLNAVGHPRCGSRASFGASSLGDERLRQLRELMPSARSVCAKSYDFDERGDELNINYAQMLKIVLDAGYRGHVAIEYEGTRLSEQAGLARAKQLLDRVSARLSQQLPTRNR
jgi:sugar phosphate isomerase/epimerase